MVTDTHVNLVTISLDEYNSLRDIKLSIENKKFYAVKTNYGSIIRIYSLGDTISELIDINKEINKELETLNNEFETLNNEFEDLKNENSKLKENMVNKLVDVSFLEFLMVKLRK